MISPNGEKKLGWNRQLTRRMDSLVTVSSLDTVTVCGTPPRHGDIDDRAEEEEHNKLGKSAFHGTILRR